MRGRTWLTCLALVGVIASVGCEPLFTGIEIGCIDLFAPCDGNGGASAATGPAKRLRVTTITTGTPLDSTVRYQFNVTNDIGGAGWPIAPNHSEIYLWGSSPIGVADHRVELWDVPTQCEVQGENPRTVMIVPKTPEEFEASPIETTFEVVCS
jgi:hypothetical protein